VVVGELDNLLLKVIEAWPDHVLELFEVFALR
jgi:hypothetical protein